MKLCLKVPGKAKGSANTSSRLRKRRLDIEGLMGNGVSTKLGYSCWKPQATLLHCWPEQDVLTMC